MNDRSIQLAVLALQEEVPNITTESLKRALCPERTGEEKNPAQKILRRKEVAEVLNVSLREVDRLIAPAKNSKKRALPIVQLGARAIGILEKDLDAFIQARRKG